MFIMPVGAASVSVSKSYNSFTQSAVDATAYTFSGVAIGTAATGRRIVVGVSANNSSNAVSTLTVGGVSATLVAVIQSSGGQGELWECVLATGTTADVVVTPTASNSACGVTMWSLYDTGGTYHDSGTSDSDTAPSVSIDIPAGGVVLAVQGSNRSGAKVSNFTFGNIDEDHETNGESNGKHAAASKLYAEAQSSLAITSGPAETMNQAGFSVASWGP